MNLGVPLKETPRDVYPSLLSTGKSGRLGEMKRPTHKGKPPTHNKA